VAQGTTCAPTPPPCRRRSASTRLIRGAESPDSCVMAGLGHPRLVTRHAAKTWVTGPSPVMTQGDVPCSRTSKLTAPGITFMALSTAMAGKPTNTPIGPANDMTNSRTHPCKRQRMACWCDGGSGPIVMIVRTITGGRSGLRPPGETMVRCLNAAWYRCASLVRRQALTSPPSCRRL
jgi:hypothetical protein